MMSNPRVLAGVLESALMLRFAFFLGKAVGT